ncbi:hypothetical protein F5X97DRAFT_191987 [Nemania serpens]|nr:hypothetical protein F5X97DRAFT_191987 [Nemania serpens]
MPPVSILTEPQPCHLLTRSLNVFSILLVNGGLSWGISWLSLVSLFAQLAHTVNILIIGHAIHGIGETVQLSFNVAIGELAPNKYPPAVPSFICPSRVLIASNGPVIDLLPSRSPFHGLR